MARTKQTARITTGGKVPRRYARLPSMQTQKSKKKRRIDNLDDSDDEGIQITMENRENDFNERTWWMVDIDNYESNQGATPLVKRCMRKYEWGLDESKKVLKAYRQFLELKTELEDWDGSVLSPSPLVKQMWQEHVLDTENYFRDSMVLCGGQIMWYDPNRVLDQEAKEAMDERTRTDLIERFGSENVNRDVWGFPSDPPTKTDRSTTRTETEKVLGGKCSVDMLKDIRNQNSSSGGDEDRYETATFEELKSF